MNNSNLACEWSTLQNQYDSYEKHSLLIKLCNVFIFCIALFTSMLSYYVLIINVVLWLQDGIWKTFQARIEGRLLVVEQLLSNDIDANHSNNAFQFNLHFCEDRKHGLELIKEYLKQALRPTVAFPHIILVIVQMTLLF